jgi:hypothetical protein
MTRHVSTQTARFYKELQAEVVWRGHIDYLAWFNERSCGYMIGDKNFRKMLVRGCGGGEWVRGATLA